MACTPVGWLRTRHHRKESAPEELARQQQEQLQFTSRLVTMGEMASTLAHELNQPLAAIASYNAGCLNLRQTGLHTAEIKPAWKKSVFRRSGRQNHPPRP
ncbi:MAG: hypothetical protein IPL05_00025 [Betaproteobacteria bacterium]|nr:hypothetical protein [Betaproteobacteria bacterium]